MAEVQAWINAVETHLMRENMKKVLGVVYLNTWIAQNTSVPTCGLMEYLARDANDRAAEVKLTDLPDSYSLWHEKVKSMAINHTFNSIVILIHFYRNVV